MPGDALPIDVWLLIFPIVDDPFFVWSVLRNVNSVLRAYVDEFFSHGVIRNTLVSLHYSKTNVQYEALSTAHLPMVFDRLSDDGSRAIFQQRAYRFIMSARGSLRGWVPSIESYYDETGQQPPELLPQSTPHHLSDEDEEVDARLSSEDYKYFKRASEWYTSERARGVLPPFFVKVFGDINHTDLVALSIDCTRHEISFDWRQTYTLFFREQRHKSVDNYWTLSDSSMERRRRVLTAMYEPYMWLLKRHHLVPIRGFLMELTPDDNVLYASDESALQEKLFSDLLTLDESISVVEARTLRLQL